MSEAMKPGTPWECEEMVAGNGSIYWQAKRDGEDIAHGNRWLPVLVDEANKQAATAREVEELRAEVERLREIVVRYGDRVRMANAPAELQQEIDEAFARAARVIAETLAQYREASNER